MAAIAQAAATAALKPSLKTVSDWTCGWEPHSCAIGPQPSLTHACSPPPCLQRAARSRTVQVKAVASVEQAAAAGVKVRLQRQRRRQPGSGRLPPGCRMCQRLAVDRLQQCCRTAAQAWRACRNCLPACCRCQCVPNGAQAHPCLVTPLPRCLPALPAEL